MKAKSLYNEKCRLIIKIRGSNNEHIRRNNEKSKIRMEP